MLGFHQVPQLCLPVLLTTNLVGLTLQPLLSWLCGHELYRGARTAAQVAVTGAAILLGTLAAGGVSLLILGCVTPGLRFSRKLVLNFALFTFVVSGIVSTLRILFFTLKARIEQKAVEIQKLRELEARTRLAALQGKVDPHFLFNTLNTMLGLVDRAPRQLETLILGLSDLYRRVLQMPETGLIPLSEELELVRRYLEIEAVRLGHRLAFALDLDPAAADCPVPPLLVEPLVENALKHGIGPRAEGGRVRVETRDLGDRVRITVEDDGAGCPDGMSSGFGLYSIRERLRLVHGGDAHLEAGGRPEGGFRAVLVVPHAH